jgi:putative hydrolase of the HAD superfamily
VARLEACLIDAYDTIVKCDFSPLRYGVPALAGIAVDRWEGQYSQVGPMLNDGRMSKAEAFGRILANCGVQPTDALLAEMVRQDQELLLAHACLYDDVLPFLGSLRNRGIKTAIVSNCTQNTRGLLVATGVAALSDTLVLSCEVGAAKPAPEIFQCALDRLGVTADAAVFVDDQPGYCAGSAAMGIRTVQIVRADLDGLSPAAGTAVVRSLPEVEAMFPD